MKNIWSLFELLTQKMKKKISNYRIIVARDFVIEMNYLLVSMLVTSNVFHTTFCFYC